MPPRRALRPDAEVAVSGHVEPLLLHGGQVVKSLSVGFLMDFEQHWRTHGKKVLDILAEKSAGIFRRRGGVGEVDANREARVQYRQ